MKNYKNILELKAKQREKKERFIFHTHTHTSSYELLLKNIRSFFKNIISWRCKLISYTVSFFIIS